MGIISTGGGGGVAVIFVAFGVSLLARMEFFAHTICHLSFGMSITGANPPEINVSILLTHSGCLTLNSVKKTNLYRQNPRPNCPNFQSKIHLKTSQNTLTESVAYRRIACPPPGKNLKFGEKRIFNII